jgi:hypothetical protein
MRMSQRDMVDGARVYASGCQAIAKLACRINPSAASTSVDQNALTANLCCGPVIRSVTRILWNAAASAFLSANRSKPTSMCPSVRTVTFMLPTA